MPLVELARGRRGPIVFVVMTAVVIVGLIVIAINDFCPAGFVRECVHAVWGYLTDVACECVPAGR